MDTPPFFDKILIANRGEIACRVIASCRRLGIASVAVYSDADCDARHVRLADEAVRIGPAPATDSYLRGAAILAAARASGAQAIHPGYGFLSENAGFAEACAEAGIVFIGPPAAAIRAMGDKSAAKALMQAAGVPLTPGYHGDRQQPGFLRGQADAIGYPVLIKASAGGGGKGMRKVERGDDFEAALAACQREARNAFGNDHVLVEKYVERPRHIEIQVFGDHHGNVLHLFERDCSVQRRHQKVLEEAPAPGMSEARRAAMGQAAVDAARAVGYVGAGTVEFIVSPNGDFWFMEMNTRLQVEHPVTEMITGTDLVEWQLRVAAGLPLPVRQEQLAIHGHAIEARLYAEDADRDFLPATGTLRHLRLPEPGPHMRIDTGIEQGDAITPFYDPMIAKLIVWDRDRDGALRRMRQALAQCEVIGLATNAGFLARLLDTASFSEPDLDTSLIEREHDVLFAPAIEPPLHVWAAAAVLLSATVPMPLPDPADPDSPWHAGDGWRIGAAAPRQVQLQCREQLRSVHLYADGQDWQLDHDGQRLPLRLRQDGADGRVLLGDAQQHLRLVTDGADALVWFAHGRALRLQRHDPLAASGDDEAHAGSLGAPMPGRIVALAAQAGDRLSRGQPLLVMEAMKMEHTLLAPHDGVLQRYLVKEGERVEEGRLLAEIAPDDPAR